MLTRPARTSSARGSSTLFQAYLATGGPVILGTTHYGIEPDILGLVIVTVMARRTVSNKVGWKTRTFTILIYTWRARWCWRVSCVTRRRATKPEEQSRSVSDLPWKIYISYWFTEYIFTDLGHQALRNLDPGTDFDACGTPGRRQLGSGWCLRTDIYIALVFRDSWAAAFVELCG